MITFSISFCWYWFPDFIFPALSYFTFLCWIFPKNRVVNQIFGMKSGLGVLPLTFDCECCIRRPFAMNRYWELRRESNCIHWITIGCSNLGNCKCVGLAHLLDLHRFSSIILFKRLVVCLSSHPEQLGLRQHRSGIQCNESHRQEKKWDILWFWKIWPVLTGMCLSSKA